MKIRIKGNSVRLRLTKTDVDTFAETGKVEEKTEFGKASFGYVLQKSNGYQLKAEFADNTIIVLMPEAMANQWTSTEKVGYQANMPLGEDKSLFLLIEKDFKCLDETIEDQSDNYDNPLMQKQ